MVKAEFSRGILAGVAVRVGQRDWVLLHVCARSGQLLCEYNKVSSINVFLEADFLWTNFTKL